MPESIHCTVYSVQWKMFKNFILHSKYVLYLLKCKEINKNQLHLKMKKKNFMNTRLNLKIWRHKKAGRWFWRFLGMADGFWLISERIEIFSICFSNRVRFMTDIENIYFFFENSVFLCSKLKFQKFLRRYDLRLNSLKFET